MKLKIILAGLLCTIIAPPAQAVTKCVALNSSTTCTIDDYKNHTDWASTCTTYGVSTPVSGIGICSSTDGGSGYQTATELDTSSTPDDNKYCWCRMISPAVSRWVYSAAPATIYCDRYCANNCATNLYFYPAFRRVLFGSLSD